MNHLFGTPKITSGSSSDRARLVLVVISLAGPMDRDLHAQVAETYCIICGTRFSGRWVGLVKVWPGQLCLYAVSQLDFSNSSRTQRAPDGCAVNLSSLEAVHSILGR